MNIDYKKVFQLAQEKGYKFNFEWDSPYKRTYKHLDDWKAIDEEIIDANPNLIFSELTLIQKWLGDNYRIKVYEIPYTSGKNSFQIWNWNTEKVLWEDTDKRIEEHIEAIYEALKLLP